MGGYYKPDFDSKVSMSLAQFGRQECTVLVHLTGRERDVLAALLAHDPNRAVTVDRLIELVWPDPELEPESASIAINVVITRLRKKGIQVLADEWRGHYIAHRIPSPMSIGGTNHFLPIPVHP